MKLILYKMVHDDGFAPNPYFGILTLATCKPKIRAFKNVNVGDWISGWSCKSLEPKTYSTPVGQEKLIWLGKIAEKIPIAQYWFKFPQKRPTVINDKTNPKYYGDNIYEPIADNPLKFRKIRGHFHQKQGCTNNFLQHDTEGKNVLICYEFYYFGAEKSLNIPYEIKNGFPEIGRGHKIFEDDEKILQFIKYVQKNKKLCKFSGGETKK